MTEIVGVRFKRVGKIYYFAPDSLDIKKGTNVVVETVRGLELGEIVIDKKMVNDEEIVQPLKSILRIANADDLKKLEDNKRKEKEAFTLCTAKIAEHKLDMKLVDVEYTFDNSKILFYFISDERIDFRELVRDLAFLFKTRIELRQIGVRDEAKIMGGLGICGLPFCCSTFLTDFAPVSIKMAKEQNLSLNSSKISGTCGRLMCCLKYEQDTYEAELKSMPRTGSKVKTPMGNGVVLDVNPIKRMLTVRVETGIDETVVKTFSADELNK